MIHLPCDDLGLQLPNLQIVWNRTRDDMVCDILISWLRTVLKIITPIISEQLREIVVLSVV